MNSDDSVDERISAFIDSLPVLTKDDLDLEDSCPICLTSYEAILQDSESGVTKLDCHIFCRKDLVEWIRNLHGNCPTCRHEFLDIHPPGSDDESSDGGEYIPNDDDEDEEDVFIDTSDGFTEGDFDTEDMDVDLEDIWERSDGEGREIGAESEPSSEGDNSMDDQEEAVEVNVSILEGDDQEYSSDDAQAEEPK